MYPYRVFISYAHVDRPRVEQLVEVLRNAGMTPLWDKDLLPGTGFSEQIQSFIRNSHVFLPFITDAAAKRPWLHQEIGFATALGKPILPVTLGGLPLGIISEIQAVLLKDDLSDAGDKLSADYFRMLFDRKTERTISYECPEDNTRRAILLADYADGIWAIRQHGVVRQRASLGSYCWMDRGETDPVWRKYFPATPDDITLFRALRQELVALQRHAKVRGCRLILDPVDRLEIVFRKQGLVGVKTRVSGLLRFLEDKEAVKDVVVAFNDEAERTVSITLVGDWFSSEAVSSGGTRVLREALFTRDAQTVRQQVEDFDNRMQDLLAISGWDEASSRGLATTKLQAYLDQLSARQ
jgi:hypothetical protein